MELSEGGFRYSCKGLKRDTIILIAWTHYSKVAQLKAENVRIDKRCQLLRGTRNQLESNREVLIDYGAKKEAECAQLEAELKESMDALAQWMKVHDARIDELESENEALKKLLKAGVTVLENGLTLHQEWFNLANALLTGGDDG